MPEAVLEQKATTVAPPISAEVETKPEAETQHEPEAPPEILRIAKAMGWKPKEEFNGEYLDPEEWIIRSQKINKVLKSEVTDLKRTLSKTKEHISRVEKAAIERTIREMTSQRDHAIEAGDVSLVRQFDNAIDQEKTKLQQSTEQPDLAPELKDWASENQWFFNDPEMKALALAVQNKIVASGERVDDLTMLKRITARVKEKFPEKFAAEAPAQSQSQAPKVEGSVANGGGASSNRSNKFSFNDLNEVEKKACQDFERRGVLTREEYLADIKKIRGV